RLQYDLVDRRAANAEEYVVVHFEALDAVEDLHAGTGLSLAQDKRVVDETITTISISGTVAANAGHARALRRNVLKHISHDIRIFTRSIVANVLVAVWIRANQFDLTVKTARHPVVVNLVALRATLDVVATVLIVQVAILHAKHRARMGKLVRRHIDWMLPGATTAVIDLDILHQQRAGVSIRSEYSVSRTIVDHTITQGNVVSVVVNSSKAATRHVETFEDIMVRQA